jgi:hypothetical protein
MAKRGEVKRGVADKILRPVQESKLQISGYVKKG